MRKYARALTIAGSDNGGGAGIQADLKTFAALGCYGMSAITALTAQNTQGIQAIQTVSADFVVQQIDSIMDDIGVDAVKTGMLHRKEIIDEVAEYLSKHKIAPLIIDPVMVGKDGSHLLQENAIESLCKKLFPLATLITPNLAEAETLLKRKIHNQTAMQQAAQDLSQWGSAAVLLKGGHLRDMQSSDCLYISATQEIHWFTESRIATINTHGTGCTLAAAITALLAKKYSLFKAINQAKQYISHAIVAGSKYHIGKGHGPVHHFYNLWEKL